MSLFLKNLPIRDNLRTRDNASCTKVSLIKRFHCNHVIVTFDIINGYFQNVAIYFVYNNTSCSESECLSMRSSSTAPDSSQQQSQQQEEQEEPEGEE